jgi:hypothetical protein
MIKHVCSCLLALPRWRLVVEESHSFGVLGKAGKGAAEHFGLGPSQVGNLCACVVVSSIPVANHQLCSAANTVP